MLALHVFLLHLVVFAAVNGLLAYAAWALARFTAKGAFTWEEQIAAAIVFATAQVCLSQIVLGLIGALSWWPVMALNAVVAVGIILLVRRGRRAPPLTFDNPEDPSRDQLAKGVLLAVCVMMFVQAYKIVRNPPFGADSLGYHLPLAVEWLQTGRILIHNAVPFAFYPGGSELVDLWLLLPFRSTLLVNLQNWPFTLLIGLSLYSLARRAGCTARWSLYAGLFFLGIRSVQIVLGFTSLQDNDLLIAAFFVAAICFIVAAVGSNNRSVLIAAGVACGLLISTKLSGIGYAGLAIGVYLFLAVARRRTQQPIVNLAIIIGCAVLTGGYWYLRNLILSGNPLVVIPVQLAGVTLFAGKPVEYQFYESTALLARIGSPRVLDLLIEQGLLRHGGLIVILTIPALLLLTSRWAYRWAVRRQWSPVETTLQILVPWGALVLYLATPLLVENVPGTLNQLEFGYSPVRFGFSLWAFGGLLVAVLLSDGGWWKQSWLPEVFAALIILHSSVTMLEYQPETAAPALLKGDLVTFVALLAGALIVEQWWRRVRRPILRWSMPMLGVIVLMAGVLWPAYHLMPPSSARLYEHKMPGYTAIRQHVEAAHIERISIVSCRVLNGWFAFSGPELATRVIFCPSGPQAWVDCALNNEVELVAFESCTATPSNREAYATQEYPARFSPLYADDFVRLYRVQ